VDLHFLHLQQVILESFCTRFRRIRATVLFLIATGDLMKKNTVKVGHSIYVCAAKGGNSRRDLVSAYITCSLLQVKHRVGDVTLSGLVGTNLSGDPAASIFIVFYPEE